MKSKPKYDLNILKEIAEEIGYEAKISHENGYASFRDIRTRAICHETGNCPM